MKRSTPVFSVPERNPMSDTQALRVGIGGPVGSGKTALTLSLCRALRDKWIEQSRKFAERARSIEAAGNVTP